GLAVADFNNDGRLDVAVTGPPITGVSGGNPGNSATTGILLGNGDGTFQPVRILNIAGGGPAVAGSFNGSGKADLVVGSSVLLGNGDGTFQTGQTNGTFQTFQSSGFRYLRVVADFNVDGKPDLASAYFLGTGIAVNLGNGDGTFQAAQNFSAPEISGL